ncbi:hypothetical protein [Altererythrobacter aquiaggeris]|uniref:hypothetical protein n=1 Tax=Aestuarierythrobacter aquiaggeris TaxID=1898396 RepID=UPI00301974D1
MEGALEWVASLGAVVAAAMIALDLDRRITGFGFVLFCIVSVMWIISGVTGNAMPIAAMNAVLLVINGWGVWQYLINPKRKEAGPGET